MDLLNRRTLLLAALCVAVIFQPALAQSREYKLKAAFIYNFIKFVEWPSQSGPIKVGVLGKDPFQGELNKLERKKVAGRALSVVQLKSVNEVGKYQVVFTDDPALAKKLIAVAAGKPILTVSDVPSFSKNGGGIGLISARNRIRFNVNQSTLKKAKIKASSKLLGLANNVYSLHGLGRFAKK